MRRLGLHADVASAGRALLGRVQPAAFEFRNESGRSVEIEYAPVVPAGIEPLTHTRRVRIPGNGCARDPFALTLALGVGLRCVFETYRVDINEDAEFGPWRALNYHRKNLVGIGEDGLGDAAGLESKGLACRPT